jgi:hypothetical protein
MVFSTWKNIAKKGQKAKSGFVKTSDNCRKLTSIPIATRHHCFFSCRLGPISETNNQKVTKNSSENERAIEKGRGEKIVICFIVDKTYFPSNNDFDES